MATSMDKIIVSFYFMVFLGSVTLNLLLTRCLLLIINILIIGRSETVIKIIF